MFCNSQILNCTKQLRTNRMYFNVETCYKKQHMKWSQTDIQKERYKLGVSEGGVSEFQLKSQEISQHGVNPMATCILTVAGGQSAACLRTCVEVGRDRSAANGDVRGWLAFPTASPSKLISDPSFTCAPLCPGPHGPAQTFLYRKPLGSINQVFKGI